MTTIALTIPPRQPRIEPGERPFEDLGCRLNVCFVALNALPVIIPGTPGPIGGMETRAWLFAQELAKRPDVAVSFALHAASAAPSPVVQGVTLQTSVEPLRSVRNDVARRTRSLSRFPWLQVVHWHPSLLWKVPLLALCRPFVAKVDPLTAVHRCRADVHCVFGVNRTSDAVIQWARQRGSVAVLFLTHDSDLDRNILDAPDFVDAYGEPSAVRRRALQSADEIVAQTEQQRDLLWHRFGRSSVVIHNPIDTDRWLEGCAVAEGQRCWIRLPSTFVLWIGRADSTHKRPRLCLELARRLPEIPFVMVMNPRQPDVEQAIWRHHPSNVQILAHVSPAEMPALMRRARLLLSTSAQEGFAGAFLQATLSGLPIVSLQVGAEFLQEIGFGAECGGDLDMAAQRIEQYWDTPIPSGVLAAARQRLIARHGLAQQTEKLLQVLQETVQRKRARLEKGH